MRIVIDMQGAQTANRFNEIGQDAVSFAQAVTMHRGEHEVILVLNGMLADSIEPIRAVFDKLLPQENIRIWNAPCPVRQSASANDTRRKTAELIREAFLASLQADIIHISSFFEGYDEDAVTSIGKFDKNALVSIQLTHTPHSSVTDLAAWHDFCQRKYEEAKLAQIRLPPGVDARQAIKHWEEAKLASRGLSDTSSGKRKPKLAFVSPFPPEKTGIADYSAELLPDLAKYYDIEVITAQEQVDSSLIKSHAEIRDVTWLRTNAQQIDRVLYHIGNSHMHKHMVDLLAEIPGAVVLHDFYLGGLMSSLDDPKGQEWAKALYNSHGYAAVRDLYRDYVSANWNHPANWPVLQYAKGIISHSNYSRTLAQKYYGIDSANDWAVIPLLRAPAERQDKQQAKKRLGFSDDDFIICSFGHTGPTKLNHRLLDCWLKSALAQKNNCHLIFVGENEGASYGKKLLDTIKASGCSERIRITGFVSSSAFRDYLQATDLAVQLRTLSRGETSATVLDGMNYYLPVIANANGAMAELPEESVCLLPDEFDDAELTEAMEKLWRKPELRHELGERAHRYILEHHTPEKCARQYFEAIENFYKNIETDISALIKAISTQKNLSHNNSELEKLSSHIAATLPLRQPAKRLFLDVSAICRDDLKTGIQRVVRSLILELLESPPAGFRIDPFYITDAGGAWNCRYARNYTLEITGDSTTNLLQDDIIDPQCGDIILALDFSPGYIVESCKTGLFKNYQNLGVSVYAVVYDLLPVRLPQFFPPRSDKYHGNWLSTIKDFDGAVCISKSVADDLHAWLSDAGFNCNNRRPYSINHFHLGADVNKSAPTQGLPADADTKLKHLKAHPSFLMVGTIEPRKGHAQVLEAFEQLWQLESKPNLVIIGKTGWMMEKFIERLRNHPKLNRQLFWLEAISDEYLEKVYAASTCLIAPSCGEGFGLPLIEAAQHKLPIIARDIPVFREVAGDFAHYFQGNQPDKLAQAIKTWLVLHKNDQHPKSDTMPWLTWKESALELLEAMGLQKSQEASADN